MPKSKTPRVKNYPTNNKEVRIGRVNLSAVTKTMDHPPVWQLKILDMEHHEWGWKNLKGPVLYEVLKKLQEYESRKWSEIYANKKHDHSVDIDQLEKGARKRLEELELDDISELFRFRLNGTNRVWGILDRYIFKILWWDPNHTVCKSTKKHT